MNETHQPETPVDMARFHILLPSYILEGYEFDHAQVINNRNIAFENQVFERITLVYKSGKEWLHISEVVYEAGFPEVSKMNNVENVTITIPREKL